MRCVLSFTQSGQERRKRKDSLLLVSFTCYKVTSFKGCVLMGGVAKEVKSRTR